MDPTAQQLSQTLEDEAHNSTARLFRAVPGLLGIGVDGLGRQRVHVQNAVCITIMLLARGILNKYCDDSIIGSDHFVMALPFCLQPDVQGSGPFVIALLFCSL